MGASGPCRGVSACGMVRLGELPLSLCPRGGDRIVLNMSRAMAIHFNQRMTVKSIHIHIVGNLVSAASST